MAEIREEKKRLGKDVGKKPDDRKR
jgi:hypothetical protein